MPQRADDVIDRVTGVRRRISGCPGHEPDALVRHYQKLVQKHKDKMLLVFSPLNA